MNTYPLDSFDLRVLPLLLREFRLDPPDALFAYGGPETVLGTCLKLYKIRNNKLNLIRFRGEPLKNSHGLRKLQYALSLKYCDHVIVPNTQMAMQLAGMIDQPSVKKITLGCDETKYFFDEKEQQSNEFSVSNSFTNLLKVRV